jgi:Cyclin, N-terminal domain
MEFVGSTQEKSWMFSEESIADCRRRAAVINNTSSSQRSWLPLPTAQRVRKFASGFHRGHHSSENDTQQQQQRQQHSTNTPQPTSVRLSTSDQETLVRFHAHQIQTLVGPSALLTDLRTSQTVLSTAIMFFRRFYLSNSIVDHNPRKMATACAFFASKCEDEKVEVSQQPIDFSPHHGDR